jgi:hypothetical protein
MLIKITFQNPKIISRFFLSVASPTRFERRPHAFFFKFKRTTNTSPDVQYGLYIEQPFLLSKTTFSDCIDKVEEQLHHEQRGQRTNNSPYLLDAHTEEPPAAPISVKK